MTEKTNLRKGLIENDKKAIFQILHLNNLTKIKDWPNIINLDDEYEPVGTHSVALYANG